MAAHDLPPVPYNTPLLNSAGVLNTLWATWFRQLFFRVGGHVAKTNAELDVDGTSIFSGAGAPVGDLGGSSIGDFYFNTTNGDYYKKSGSLTWVVQGNLRGPNGAASTVPGPANTLSIGTVSTLAEGASATATITGDAPNQTLNLGIPTGPAGSAGTGAFSPDYIDEAVTVPSGKQFVAFQRVTIAAAGSLIINGRGRIL